MNSEVEVCFDMWMGGWVDSVSGVSGGAFVLIHIHFYSFVILSAHGSKNQSLQGYQYRRVL